MTFPSLLNYSSKMAGEENKHKHGWLDNLAIGMSILCAIHCLIVPIVIVAVPLIKTTFFVNEDFHLWMLLAVFPTTLASIFLGCKKHKDRYVGIACFVGLSLLVSAYFIEQNDHSKSADLGEDDQACAHCEICDHSIINDPTNVVGWVNTLGGVFLILAHSRNFYLCRKHACQHEICKDDSCACD